MTQTPVVRASVALAITLLAAWAATTLLGPALYPWIKALHIIAVISWMAGMLYLPRLFVYHCEAQKGSPQSETFKVMVCSAAVTPMDASSMPHATSELNFMTCLLVNCLIMKRGWMGSKCRVHAPVRRCA